MAEENNTNVSETTTEETSRTYSAKEFQSEVDRRVSQALKTAEAKFNDRLAENEKLARMNEQEKLTYELDKRQKELEDREAQVMLAENKATAVAILNQKGLDTSLVDLVMADKAEEMNDKIKLLENAFNTSVKTEVEKRLSGKAPRSTTSDGITREDFRKMSLRQQQEFATANPELYKQLINN